MFLYPTSSSWWHQPTLAEQENWTNNGSGILCDFHIFDLHQIWLFHHRLSCLGHSLYNPSSVLTSNFKFANITILQHHLQTLGKADLGAWIHRDSLLCKGGAVDIISQNTDVYTVVAHKDSRKSSQVLLNTAVGRRKRQVGHRGCWSLSLIRGKWRLQARLWSCSLLQLFWLNDSSG